MTAKYAKDQLPGFYNHIKKVVVVGGSGNVGRHLVEALIEKGNFEVTVVSRPSSTSKVPHCAKAWRASYGEEVDDNDSSLVEALKGQDALIVSVATQVPLPAIVQIVRAAAEAGVSYILPNYYGYDPDDEEMKRDAMLEEFHVEVLGEIMKLGVSSYFLLACNYWFEFSVGGGTDRFGFDLKKRTFLRLDQGTVRFRTTTWLQCGRAMANVLSLKRLPEDASDESTTLANFHNRAIYIASFALNQQDVFESLKRVTGTTDSDWTITEQSAKQRFDEASAEVEKGNWGLFDRMLYSRSLGSAWDNAAALQKALDNERLGLPVEDLDTAMRGAVQMAEAGTL